METEPHDKHSHSCTNKSEESRLLWSVADKRSIFLGLILFSWTTSWEFNMTCSIAPTVTSKLGANHISSILGTVVFILQTALLPMYSKLSDILGRAECYTLAVVFYAIAFILMAMAPDYKTLIGGQIFYAFGVSGTSVLGPIVIGEMTSIVNRGLFQGLYSIPTVVNIFAAPYVAQKLLDQGHWRWVYGMVPILLVLTSTPLLKGLWSLEYKMGSTKLLSNQKTDYLIPPRAEKANMFDRMAWLLSEIDLVGSVLLVAALCMVLIPLVMAIPMWGGWTSAITMKALVSGFILLVLFTLWEYKFARKPVLPFDRCIKRTTVCGIMASSTVTLMSSTNWQYFTTYLQVTRKASAQQARYLEVGYNLGFICIQSVVGYLMKHTRVWRPFMFIGVAFLVLGIGMMIPARLPSSSDYLIVITQLFAGMGSGMLGIPLIVAVQSSVPHKDLAIITALFQVGGSIAASVGSSLAGAIWNTMMPGLFAKYIPGEYDYTKIVQDIQYAISLPEEQYNGVVVAYGEVQKTLSLLAICFSVSVFLLTIPMQSFGLELHKNDGTTVLIQDSSNDPGTSTSSKSFVGQKDVSLSTQPGPSTYSTYGTI